VQKLNNCISNHITKRQKSALSLSQGKKRISGSDQQIFSISAEAVGHIARNGHKTSSLQLGLAKLPCYHFHFPVYRTSQFAEIFTQKVTENWDQILCVIVTNL